MVVIRSNRRMCFSVAGSVDRSSLANRAAHLVVRVQWVSSAIIQSAKIDPYQVCPFWGSLPASA
jgi:hypothetical protein